MTHEQQRKDDLAKIHIAKKDLGLDDDTYRQIIRDIGKAASGSSGDLNTAGRLRVLKHFKAKGWKPRRKRPSDKKTEYASEDQVEMIAAIWLRLGAAGVVKDTSERAMRIWLMNTTKRYHSKRVGFSAPQFLPKWVASRVIEQLKQWANRCGVDWRG